MSVAVYISNEPGATEVCFVPRSSKEVSLVSTRFPGAVPVRPVGIAVRGVTPVSVVGVRSIVQGETL